MNSRFTQFQQFWQNLNQVNRHNIGTASNKIKLTVIALMAAMVGVFGWLLILSPSMQNLLAAKSQEQVLIDEFADKYKQTQKFDLLSQQLLEQNTALQNKLQALPRQAMMTQIVGMINTQAQKSGVKIISASVQAGSEQQYYTQRPILVQAMGDYHALGRWLFELLQSEYLLTVQDFKLVASTNHQLEINMQIYTYQANKKPNVSKAGNQGYAKTVGGTMMLGE